jgi:hypothetical protein
MNKDMIKALFYMVCFLTINVSGVFFVLGLEWKDAYIATVSFFVFTAALICFSKVDSLADSFLKDLERGDKDSPSKEV